MFEQYHLPNKANIILVPQQDTKSVTVLVMYPVGSRYETKNLSGASHYIEHLMFKGTKKRKNSLTLTREIDRLGAEYNAFTGKESTAYYIKVDSEYTKVAIDILADMLFNSKFEPKEMEREKGPIIEELRMYRDNPIMNIDSIFEALLFSGCPLGWDIGGTDDTVRNFKRAEVLAFKEKYYSPRSMTIVVAGKITEQTRKLVSQYFGAGQNSKATSKTYRSHALGADEHDRRIVVQEKKTDQVQLMLGFPAFPYGASENTALTVLDTILGGSMSSRLFIQIRERRGLAYMIRSGQDYFRDTGYAYVRAGLDAKNINKAIGVIKNEIDKMKDKKISPRELNDAKTHLRGGLVLSMEDSSNQAGWYARQAVFYDTIKTPEQKLAEIDTVSIEDIQRLAQQVYDFQKMRLAIIGEVEKKKVQF